MQKINVCCLVALITIVISGCEKEKPLSKAQQTAIHYLYQPALICDTFSKMLWHPAIDFRGLDPDKNMLYFIAKKELSRSDMLQILMIDTTKVEFAPCETGPCEFGGMTGNIDGYYAFRTASNNLKIDTNKAFPCRYYNKDFKITFSELMAEMDTSLYYHTAAEVNLTPYFGNQTYASNVGSYISLKDKDKVVKDLAEKLTAGLKTNEQKAQALLNYVGSQVDYSFEDRWYETEVCKRAHEVLLSGDGDCSGKTTLYASLLEQCDIPYCLLYFNNHINVGLKGNYPKDNGYNIKINNELYVMAETTLDSFIIGKTRLSNDEIIREVLFYQHPQSSPFIFNAKTNNKFEFIKE